MYTVAKEVKQTVENNKSKVLTCMTRSNLCSLSVSLLDIGPLT